MRQQLKAFAAIAAVWLSGAAAAGAQTADESREAMIARGWSRLAAGQASDAATIAERALKGSPRDHDLLGLAIAARVAQKRPLAALDAYEQWLEAARAEDVFALEPVAQATLEEIAAGGDRGLALRALEALVRAGAPGAADRLGRLRAAVDPAAVRPEAKIETLKAAGPGSIPALREIARVQKGPVRAAALRALAAMNAHEASADARGFLADPDPLVRASAAIALARFGEPEGESRVKEMLASPVADIRLLGAEAYVGRGEGPWVDAVAPLLEDPNGLTRLRAAELIAPVRPELARAVLEKAATDPNPVVRADATRILAAGETGLATVSTLAAFRRMLRDADASVRLQGGVGIVNLAVPRR